MAFKRKHDQPLPRRRVKPRYEGDSKPKEDEFPIPERHPASKKKVKVKASDQSFGERLSMLETSRGPPSASGSEDNDSDDENDQFAQQTSKLNVTHRRTPGDEAEGKQDGSEERKHSSNPKYEKKKNKNAPEEASSKFPISRRRKLVEKNKKALSSISKPIWDPRFNPAVSKAAPPKGTYDFLDQYRDDEITALRSAVPRTKDEPRKQALKMELMRMQNQKAQREHRVRAEETLREAKKTEREAVEKGKMPYFLKRGEQSKRVMEDKVKGMTERQVEKARGKRAKKLAGREKKLLPFERRSARDD